MVPVFGEVSHTTLPQQMNKGDHATVQASVFAGFFAKRFPAFRDRLISDRRFLFKVVAEVLIDSGNLVHASAVSGLLERVRGAGKAHHQPQCCYIGLQVSITSSPQDIYCGCLVPGADLSCLPLCL